MKNETEISILKVGTKQLTFFLEIFILQILKESKLAKLHLLKSSSKCPNIMDANGFERLGHLKFIEIKVQNNIYFLSYHLRTYPLKFTWQKVITS